MRAITSINLRSITPIKVGKVREVFDLGDRLLMVATDRISAFDVIMPNGIPDKGKILNQLSAFWFERLAKITPNHMLSTDDTEIEKALGINYDEKQLAGRSMLVQRCDVIPIECVARGYIAGSLFKEYIASGGPGASVTVHGIKFPAGLNLCEELPYPIFTPATKVTTGHDENISFEVVINRVGVQMAEQLRTLTIALYDEARRICKHAGILLADTKFEFGLRDGELLLIDEALTPDSSRFWLKETYEPGRPQESLDKQFVRDYLESLDWDKTPPGPELPMEVVMETRARYLEIFERITGEKPRLVEG